MHSLDTLVMERSNNARKLPWGIIGPISQDQFRLIHLLDLCLKGFKSKSPRRPQKYPSNWWPDIWNLCVFFVVVVNIPVFLFFLAAASHTVVLEEFFTGTENEGFEGAMTPWLSKWINGCLCASSDGQGGSPSSLLVGDAHHQSPWVDSDREP